MKKIKYVLFSIMVLSFVMACQSVDFRKTKSGLLYKIFPGKGSDSLLKETWIVKFHAIYSLNDDSVLYTSYGKAPQFQVIQTENSAYTLNEVFIKMKKGDSAVVVQMIDTLVKKGARLSFPTKKGDRIVTNIRILEVFKVDSVARTDYEKEMEKDRPRMMKEQEEQMAKMQKQQEEQQLKADEELQKSGEMAKQIKIVEDYISAKKVNAQKTGKGTYVHIQEQGSGPAAELNKYVKVKYNGRFLRNDSTFQASTYAFQLGKDPVVRGWVEGLQLFKQGGKGTLFIPGFLAYGASVNIPGSKPYEALVFDIELLGVSDQPIPQEGQ